MDHDEQGRLPAAARNTDQSYPREPWFARRDAAAYGVVLHAHGKIAWGHAGIGGDPIVFVLTEQVSDAQLAGPHKDGVSYIFAGEGEGDLGLALDIPNRELGTKHLRSKAAAMRTGPFFAPASSTRYLAIFSAEDGTKGARACLTPATTRRARQLRSAR